jgi:hypothetical protein
MCLQKFSCRLAIASMLSIVLGACGGGEPRPEQPEPPRNHSQELATAKVPAEFIARTYVEAFGRIPDQGGWNYYTSYFSTNGCSAATLRTVTSFFKNTEFLNLGYTHAQKVLALYRGALGREPDSSGFSSFKSRLDSGTPWSQLVDEMAASAEYVSNATVICDPSLANYHTEGSKPPLPITTTVSQASLQASLDATPAGGTVTLPESALVLLTSSLIIPPGVKLATAGVTGLTGRLRYAKMARLVRNGTFATPLVRVRAGGALENVWLDGRLAYFGVKSADGQNVLTEPAATTATSIKWIRSDNPSGPQNLRFAGSTLTNGCAAGTAATENLVINWSNDNRLSGAKWTDGIFTLCENAVVTGNEVIDASDVALIAFFSENSTPQHSKFYGNKILNAGNDAFAGLGTDPWAGAAGSCAGDCNFTGTTFDGNTLWTGPHTRFVIGIGAGTRAWSFITTHGNGRGARYTNNTSGESRVRVQLAIYISGMLDVYFSGNWNGALIDYVTAPAIPANSCGIGATLANMPTYASGTMQGAVAANRDNCI